VTTSPSWKRIGASAVVSLLLLLTCLGCTENSPSARDSPDDQALLADLKAKVLEGYMKSLFAEDGPGSLRRHVFYNFGDDLEPILGEDLPEICLTLEVRSLIEAGVTPSSSVELELLGGEGNQTDGMEVEYSIPIAQISLAAGSTVGRGIGFFADGPRIQLQPTEACDSALMSR